jgi:hypothetical protein
MDGREAGGEGKGRRVRKGGREIRLLINACIVGIPTEPGRNQSGSSEKGYDMLGQDLDKDRHRDRQKKR